jgi:hypothetical protein
VDGLLELHTGDRDVVTHNHCAGFGWLAALRGVAASRALSGVQAGLGTRLGQVSRQRARAWRGVWPSLALPWGRTLPAASLLAVAPIVSWFTTHGSLSTCLSTFVKTSAHFRFETKV